MLIYKGQSSFAKIATKKTASKFDQAATIGVY